MLAVPHTRGSLFFVKAKKFSHILDKPQNICYNMMNSYDEDAVGQKLPESVGLVRPRSE
jgi:hypothetical protein